MKKPAVLIAMGALLLACAEEPPPKSTVEVVVDKAEQRTYHPSTSFVGRLKATDDVDIQAKISGYLKSRDFTEGELVERGEMLFHIDPAQYEAALKQAEAELARARANQAVAERNYKRGQELLPKGAISVSEMDRLEAAKLEADAGVKSAQARVKAAEVDLSYTVIRAPISGRIGRSDFSRGDLIGPESGVLTTLVSLDPIKALFAVSESVYLASERRRRQLEEEGQPADLAAIKVTLELSDGELYGQSGHIDYLSNRIDEDTGTIEARASIPNSQGKLRPGQYVKVLLELPYEIDAVLVPQAAVQADQQGSFVMVVGTDNVVERRNVMLGDRLQQKVVINGDTVAAGERVVVRGLQRIRAGQTVKAREIPTPSAVNAATASGG